MIINLNPVSENTRSSDYLGAGDHLVSVVSCRAAETREGKNYFEIGFVGAGGATHRERWYLSEKALWRLQRDLKKMGLTGPLDTEDEALQFAAKLGALYLEVDDAHPGCYDGIDKHGRVICIEPFDLKLSA